jgi:hypothetical protein
VVSNICSWHVKLVTCGSYILSPKVDLQGKLHIKGKIHLKFLVTQIYQLISLIPNCYQVSDPDDCHDSNDRGQGDVDAGEDVEEVVGEAADSCQSEGLRQKYLWELRQCVSQKFSDF